MKRFLRTLILLYVRLIGARAASATRTRSRSGVNLPVAPRILLIRPDHLGDLVMTTPVLQALRSALPDAHITLLVGPWSRDVVVRHPAIDQLMTCPFPGFQRASQGVLEPYKLLFELADQLKRGEYDLAINLRPDFWWGAALIYLAGIPQRIGYALQPAIPFLTRTLPFPPAEHATLSNLRLTSAALQSLGKQALSEPLVPEHYPLRFDTTSDESTWVAHRLQTAGLTPEAPIIVIHPGTGGPVKLWRNEAWASIADALTTTTLLPQPAHIVLTGSPKERPLLEQIAWAMTSSPLLITDATVGQLAALLGRAQLVLGVDNGPLHLAITQDTPTIRMYGPTDSHIFGPWGSPARHIVIASDQKCATCPFIPCGRLDFAPDELAEHPCVRLIPEARVLHAITTLLNQPSLP